MLSYYRVLVLVTEYRMSNTSRISRKFLMIITESLKYLHEKEGNPTLSIHVENDYLFSWNPFWKPYLRLQKTFSSVTGSIAYHDHILQSRIELLHHMMRGMN